jgi:hypothetical protein
VIEKIDFLLRFWELKARSDRLGDPLGPSEQLELLSLMQLVTSPRLQKAGPVARERGCVPAQVIGDGGLETVEIRHVSAAALLVAGADTFAAGSQVIVRIADAVTGVEFALPCVVTWAYKGSPSTMALTVDGIPTRTDFVTAPIAHPTLPLSPRRRLLG